MDVRKRILIVLSLCVLVLPTMQVEAAAGHAHMAATGNCVHEWLVYRSVERVGGSVGDHSHAIERVDYKRCRWCQEVTTASVVTGTASHFIVYDDLGHSDSMTHNFTRRCTQCNYSGHISTICNYEDMGIHANPK